MRVALPFRIVARSPDLTVRAAIDVAASRRPFVSRRGDMFDATRIGWGIEACPTGEQREPRSEGVQGSAGSRAQVRLVLTSIPDQPSATPAVSLFS